MHLERKACETEEQRKLSLRETRSTREKRKWFLFLYSIMPLQKKKNPKEHDHFLKRKALEKGAKRKKGLLKIGNTKRNKKLFDREVYF